MIGNFGHNRPDPTREFARQTRKKSGAEKEAATLLVWIALMAPFMLWSGFALTKLWAWFAVPLGAPAIDLGEAVGLNLLTAFLVAKPRGQKEDDGYLGRAIAFMVLEPGFAIGIGYLVHALSS